MKDDLGTRMKENYEHRTRIELPRRTNTIIRLDGKAFHSFTKNCERPFDAGFAGIMDKTAKVLCEMVQGCVLAYVQSDEISLLLQDFKKIKTDAWFDGNVQKMASISASIATAAFNTETTKLMVEGVMLHNANPKFPENALFDSRVFTIPELGEVVNYFIWRQQDCTRNSITMAAQSQFSHKALHGKNGSEKQDMLHEKGINWNDYPVGFKRGRAVVYFKGEIIECDQQNFGVGDEAYINRGWQIIDPPIFTQDRDFIKKAVTFEA